MTRPRLSAFGVLGLWGLIVLTGCFGPPAPAPTGTSAAPTVTTSPPASPTPTASPTKPASTSAAPTPTASAAPSSVPATPPATAEPTSAFPEQEAPLTIYYVAIDDNGVSGPAIGCGDSLVATTTGPVRFTDQVGPSISTLLANKSRDVGLSGLVNALYQSNLTYLGGELAGSSITIYLSGQFMLGGVCDVPRAKAQLEYTAMAASGATSARVFVNGRPIDEVLSLK
jgi:hypothetical protein